VQDTKRPLGLTVISVLWLLGALYNFFVGIATISSDLNSMPLLSDPRVHQWFHLGIPAELALGVFVVIIAIVQAFTIYGLLKRKVWSYKLALTAPVLVVFSWFAQAALYLSAPPSLGLVNPSMLTGPVMSLFWLFLVWSYIRKPHVRQYLRQALPTRVSTLQSSPNLVSDTSGSRPIRLTSFVQCPSCGHQNRIEANYCEKCGHPRSHLKQPPPPPP
jgi:hypothetical protein